MAKCIVHNTAKSSNVQLSCLESAIGAADIILIQEPWVRFDTTTSSWTTLSHSYFQYILAPSPASLRPRVVTYITRSLPPTTTITPKNEIIDPDIQFLSLQLINHAPITIINIYNEKSQLPHENTYTVDRILTSTPLSQHTIITGDFNAHHPWWNSNSTPKRADTLVEWAYGQQLILHNEPDIPTYHYRNGNGTSIIDLTFTTPHAAGLVEDWTVDDENATGSDHEVIKFTITTNTPNSDTMAPHPVQQLYNFNKANWEHFTKYLNQIAKDTIKTISDLCTQGSDQQLEQAAEILRDTLQQAAIQSIPLKKPSIRSKAWWTEQLTTKRKEMAKHKRLWKSTRQLVFWEQFKQKRNEYFRLIQNTKQSHWHNFLETADGQNLFTAYKYTKPRRVEKTPTLVLDGVLASDFTTKCDIFRTAMFPSPPTASSTLVDPSGPILPWPDITTSEIATAIGTSAPNKAPGPDGLNFLMIQKAFECQPGLFTTLYPTLIKNGYHPLCWRQGTGAILKKPGKPSYSVPKAYRIICLLNCLGKISEKIMATRLSYLAETTNMLHNEQMGGRKQRAAIDAALALTHDINKGFQQKKVVSTLFFDVKGAFDHVARPRLLDTMRQLHLPENVIHWTDNFLTNRQLGLAFDGEREPLQSVSTGIPQGSPISPVLFLIYIRFLFDTIQLKHPGVHTPSYIDDIACQISGNSEEENCEILAEVAETAFQWGYENAVAFDDPKTELIHFHRRKKTPNTPITLPNGTVIHPSKVVRWLGVHFDRKLNFKHHVNTKVSAATRALGAMSRLNTSEWGLSSLHMRQLYISCIIPIMDFGSEVWWSGQKVYANQLQSVQNIAMRKILGAFKTSPVDAMEVESSLLPRDIRLNNNCTTYTIRSITLPASHPIRQRTSATFPPEYPTGVALSHIRASDWHQTSKHHSQLWQIQHKLANTLPMNPPVESISVTLDPPWKPPTDPRISITIHPHGREAASEYHQEQLQSLAMRNDTLLIYSDGSVKNNQCGCGLVYSCGKRPQKTKAFNLGKNFSPFETELMGLLKATEVAIHQATQHRNLNSIYLFSDSQSALKRIFSSKPRPGQQLCLQVMSNLHQILQINPSLQIYLHWVPGHTEIHGNETADQQAKIASTQRYDHNNSFTSLNWIKSEIRKANMHSWSTRWRTGKKGMAYREVQRGEPSSKPHRLSTIKNRTVSTAIHQFRLGHGYFKDYLKRFSNNSNSSNNQCQCGKAPQTRKHLLLRCKLYWKERKRILGNATLPFLLGTKEGQQKLGEFVLETGVGTRKWLLGKQSEENERWGWGRLNDEEEGDEGKEAE